MNDIKRREVELTIEQNKRVVVICGTPFCGACKMLGSYIEKDFESVYPNIKFVKFDVSTDDGDISEKYDIKSVPTILMFEKGELIGRIDGFVKPDDLTKKLTVYNKE